MTPVQVTHKIEGGTQFKDVGSLSELADYRVESIIVGGNAPRRINLQRGPNDAVGLSVRAYHTLKHEYLQSGTNNPAVDVFIESIETRIKSIETRLNSQA